MAVDVPKMQDTQSEAPSFAGIGQTNETIGKMLILSIPLGTIAKTCRADPKSAPSQRDADITCRPCRRAAGRPIILPKPLEEDPPACSAPQTCASAAGSIVAKTVSLTVL